MAKASDNQFPYVHLVPAAAPASPSAGQRLYLDSGDSNKLKRKDTGGTVTTIEGGGGSAGPTTVWFAAAAMGAVGTGSPTLGNVDSVLPAWLLDASAVENVGGSTELPADWTTFHVDIYWTPTTATAGNVYLDGGQGFITSGVTFSGSYLATGGAVASPAIVNRVAVRRLATSLTRTGTLFAVRVTRVASDAADTYNADVAILGVLFTKAT